MLRRVMSDIDCISGESLIDGWGWCDDCGKISEGESHYFRTSVCNSWSEKSV